MDCPWCGESGACVPGCHGADICIPDPRDEPATESEAHLEWHLNSGVPVGTPGCPQDACHVDYDPREEEEIMIGLGEIDGSETYADFLPPADDDLPF